MRVFLAGATGAIGRRLVPKLLAGGHEVTALARSDAKASEVRRAGAVPAQGDAFDPEGLERLVVEARPDVVVNQLTALPAAVKPRKLAAYYAANDRVRREGGTNLLNAAISAGAKRIVVQSVAFWYAPGDGALDLKRESDPFYIDAPEPIGAAARTMEAVERQTLESGLEAVILRYGFLYGPGTWYTRDGDVGRQMRQWRYPIVGKGDGVYSFVHIDDAVDATVAALQRAPEGIYNVVDDQPMTARESMLLFAKAIGAPRPMRVPTAVARIAAGKAVVTWMESLSGASNAKLTDELQWHPRFANVETGFVNGLTE